MASEACRPLREHGHEAFALASHQYTDVLGAAHSDNSPRQGPMKAASRTERQDTAVEHRDMTAPTGVSAAPPRVLQACVRALSECAAAQRAPAVHRAAVRAPGLRRRSALAVAAASSPAHQEQLCTLKAECQCHTCLAAPVGYMHIPVTFTGTMA